MVPKYFPSFIPPRGAGEKRSGPNLRSLRLIVFEVNQLANTARFRGGSKNGNFTISTLEVLRSCSTVTSI
jgi:hypothetical protein